MKRLTLILPVYNYAGELATTLSRLKTWRDQAAAFHIDIVFSDDGSTDETVAILRKWITQQNGGWHLITHVTNTGKGGAIRRAVNYARALQPDVIVNCDCDLHYGLNIITDRLVPALDTADIAIVDRSWRRHRVKAKGLRRLASAIFNRCVAILTGVAFRDTQAGLKAFRAEACWPIFESLTIDGFTFDVEILSIALFYRFRVKQIPIKITKAAPTTTVSLLRSSLRMIVDLIRINLNWKTNRYDHPALTARIESEVYEITD